MAIQAKATVKKVSQVFKQGELVQALHDISQFRKELGQDEHRAKIDVHCLLHK